MIDGRVLGSLRVRKMEATPSVPVMAGPRLPWHPLSRVPTDAEATQEYARRDAREIVRECQETAYVCRSRVSLPSGVVGYRWFALSDSVYRMLGSYVSGATEIIERLTA